MGPELAQLETSPAGARKSMGIDIFMVVISPSQGVISTSSAFWRKKLPKEKSEVVSTGWVETNISPSSETLLCLQFGRMEGLSGKRVWE